MGEIQIYHNPRCSKSRETLALLQEKVLPEKGLQLHIIEYLKDTPDEAELTRIIKLLGISPRELLRTKEDAWKEHNLADTSLTDKEIIAAMVASPKLIERPIVIHNGQARIGRPPEQVLEIF